MQKKLGLGIAAFISLMLVAAMACGTDAASQTPAASGQSEEKATQPAAAETASVSGAVTYRERIALSPEAVVTVRLQDISKADAPAATVGEQVIENPGQAPVPFEIEYESNAIDEQLTYAIQAEISDRGNLVFTTTRSYPVITRGNPSEVEIVLSKVAREPVKGDDTYAPAPEAPAAPEVLCMTTLAAQLPIELTHPGESIATGFDGVNVASCTFPQPIEKVSVVLIHAASGLRHVQTFTLPEPSPRVSFPLPDDALSFGTLEEMQPGEYERVLQAIAAGGEVFDLTADYGALGAVTLVAPEAS